MKILTKKQLEEMECDRERLQEREEFYKHELRISRKLAMQAKAKCDQVKAERDQLKRELEAAKKKIPETVTFKERYETRFEELKKECKLQPEPHRLEIEFEDGSIDSLEGDAEELREFAEGINDAIDEDFVYIKGRYYRRDSIAAFEFHEGHPQEYNEAEIDEWADEALNNEIESWKVVVKKPFELPKGLAELAKNVDWTKTMFGGFVK